MKIQTKEIKLLIGVETCSQGGNGVLTGFISTKPRAVAEMVPPGVNFVWITQRQTIWVIRIGEHSSR